jgi:hypothetical protein
MFQHGRKDAVAGALIGVGHRARGHGAAFRCNSGGPVPGNRHSSSVGHGIHNTIVS